MGCGAHNYKKEVKLDNQPDSLSKEKMERVLFQMKNSVCKINLSNGGSGTGFFIKIPSSNKLTTIPVLITSNHVLNKDQISIGKTINFSLNNEKIKYSIQINNSRKTYTDIEKDVTIIEIEPEKDKINFECFLDYDENIYKDNPYKTYKNKSIYVLHYINGKAIKYSLGRIKYILEDKYTIYHVCTTEIGSSGGPIINLRNLKVMGIHKGSNILNLGTLIKASIDEYNEIKNNNNNFNDLKKEEDNQIEEYKKKEKVLIIFDKLWILWLDPNINNSQNIKYQNEFNKINNINFIPFTETRKCIESIQIIRYEKTFIIISGEIVKDFYKEFEKIINKIEILPEILIFTKI